MKLTSADIGLEIIIPGQRIVLEANGLAYECPARQSGVMLCSPQR